MNTCDIIIPTYNGKEKLAYTIPALLEQEIPSSWKVRLIISDDGSSESIEDTMSAYTWNDPWVSPLILKSSHVGRAAVRNKAIDAATSGIILLMADDIVLRAGALREHLVFHTQYPEDTAAALGCVAWDPRVRPTPLMDWMMHGGQQNDYDSILGASTCSAAHYFYGSFVSVKKKFLGEERFSEKFLEYGWEDLELGARLEKRGMVLHVLHNARSLHHHRYTATAILERQRTVGSAKYLVNTNSIRRGIHFIYGILGGRLIARYYMKKWGDMVTIPRLFEIITAGEFWYGVHHTNSLLKSEKE